MRTSIVLLMSVLLLSACASSPAWQSQLVDATADGQALKTGESRLAAVVHDGGLELRLRPVPSGVLVIVNTNRKTEITVDWEGCAFVWPDGKREAVLGATPLLGAGQIGLRAPTALTPGLPVTLALTPASRAGREVFPLDTEYTGERFTLVLALIKNGEKKVYELSFTLSS